MSDLDIKKLIELSKQDPEQFEAYRKALIDEFIQSAPEESQRRLRGLQFQIECIRDKSKNPIQASYEISKLMWDSLHKLHTTLQSGKVSTPDEDKGSAKVLSFKKEEVKED